MKIWNLNVNRGADGSKHLDLQIHGVIDGGWMDEGQGVASSEIISELNKHLDAKTIGVRINSVGGSAFGGVAVYNSLQSHPGDVTCTVEGLAASAASLIAMAGKCTMGRGAMMMIHPPLAMAMGNATELRKTADFLDKVQSSLATIYTAKTGKSLDAVNKLIDAETWMTADEAVASGFADSVGESVAESDPKMISDGLLWQGVKFPTAALPALILAMARPDNSNPRAPGAPNQQPQEATMDRATLQAKYPDLLNALLAEGKTAGIEEAKKAAVEARAEGAKAGHGEGVAAERARLKAIDDLKLAGCDDLVLAAKYGDKPSDAPALAVVAIQAGNKAVTELLAARKKETEVAAGVRPTTPQGTEEAELAAAKNIAAFANRRTGGSK